jgi:hypothetical protein
MLRLEAEAGMFLVGDPALPDMMTVERELAARDAVGIPADQRAEVRRVLDVAGQRVETKRYIAELP